MKKLMIRLDPRLIYLVLALAALAASAGASTGIYAGGGWTIP